MIVGPFTSSTPTTVYSAIDDDGESYVFAGVNPNNWVQLGDLYWRIICFNGDGSLRLIYSGTRTPSLTGSNTQIGVSLFNENVSLGNDSDNAHLGYMYGQEGATTYETAHANVNESTLKKTLDTWYKNNLINYNEIIDLNAVFCNDRRVATAEETFGDDDTKKGYSAEYTLYAPLSRFMEIYNVISGTTMISGNIR